ncbi:MAG: hypothetical protein ACRDL4_07795, partial [Thermoleophilaceae bacterium]
EGFDPNFINVVAPDSAVGSVSIDGTPIPAQDFTPIGSSGFSGAQVPVALGSHTVTSPQPIGVHSYGFGSFDSYGYPGGLSLSEVARVENIALTPKTATSRVGSPDCVDARVTDQNGSPLRDIRVDFTVEGANTASGFAFTGVDGVARFCYTGSNTGDDQIRGAVGNLADTATKTWTTEGPPPPPDTTPPDTPILSGPPAQGNDRTATFTFGATEFPARFECSLDGGPFVPCSSPFTTPELDPGQHTFVVRAIDDAGNADPTPTVYNFEIARLTLADLSDPTQGVTVNVARVRGRVLIGIPRPGGSATVAGARASQKGIDFVPLTEPRQIPVGSFLDTSRGAVALQSARNRAGDRQTGTFTAGLFQVRQSRKRRTRGLTTLVLKGRSFRRCRSTRPHGRDASAARHRRRIRRVRAQARGRFRTRGRYSSATVRGTRWATIDRCDGTLTRVYRGRVAVRDFRRKRNILVTARDRSYFAKAPR